ncbi:DUF4397 domain-containing protein [Roseateles violae]|uniref:DUF4397 domain-containing protein n=1 Tax=Roseateles violae TaxID=3058042 RepID=A0ABT8DSV9_9BURK|nr:DUF4397 domain-containing protein [Pelomonas sp. PFR6]MDN3919246.1 DUF4397 domain-containing protein [Pelomonas sp. PFR6]
MGFISHGRMAATALGLGAAVLLAGCGGGGSGDDKKVEIRLVNASASYASLDLKVADNTVNSNVAYGSAGSYASVSTSDTASQLVSGGTALATTTPTLTAGYKYSLIGYGWAGAMRTALLQEGETAPASGSTKLLVLNLAPDAGALDIYLSASCSESLDNATALAASIAGGSGSGYTTTTAGTYCLRVTGAGRKDDLRLTIPALSLPSTQVATLVVSSTSGGVLVNGITIVQTGAVSNYAGTNARARVVGALGGGNKVAVTRGGISLLQNSATPTIGEYTTVAAGADSVSISVNGAALPVQTPQLNSGGDYTLQVWGTAAEPKVSVIADDNRLPTTSGTAKLRLINGIGNMDAGLTATLDYSAIASNIAPGSASSYATISASTSSQLTISSPSFSDPVFSQPATTSSAALAIVSGGIYNIFLMGDGSALSTIKGVLRKER